MDDLDAGLGNDTLVGADTVNSWTLTGANTGTLNGQLFADIENLVGGAEADTFIFEAGGHVTGTIDGGGGTNPPD